MSNFDILLIHLESNLRIFRDDLLTSQSARNIWYWVVFFILWFISTQRIFGLPLPLVREKYLAASHENNTDRNDLADFETTISVIARAKTDFWNDVGLWLVVVFSFVIGIVSVLAFKNNALLAQAIFFPFCAFLMTQAMSYYLASRFVNNINVLYKTTLLLSYHRWIRVLWIIAFFGFILLLNYRDMLYGSTIVDSSN